MRVLSNHCRNGRCLEPLKEPTITGLCPSCKYVGRIAFAIGAFLAGALVKWIG